MEQAILETLVLAALVASVTSFVTLILVSGARLAARERARRDLW